MVADIRNRYLVGGTSLETWLRWGYLVLCILPWVCVLWLVVVVVCVCILTRLLCGVGFIYKAGRNHFSVGMWIMLVQWPLAEKISRAQLQSHISYQNYTGQTCI